MIRTNFKRILLLFVSMLVIPSFGYLVYYSALSYQKKHTPTANLEDSTTPEKPVITTIICDIGGVLLKTSTASMVRQLGASDILWYTTWEGKSTQDLRQALMYFLDYMAEQEDTDTSGRVPTFQGHPLSKNMILWQKGFLSSKEMLTISLGYIEEMAQYNYFTSEREQRLMVNMAKALLTPEKQILTKREIKSVTNLIRVLAQRKDPQGKRMYKFLIISNMEKELMPLLKAKFPKVFSIFEDIVASGEVGMIKPDEDIYEFVLDKHNLEPEECVFLDDLIENVEAARDLGIHAIQVNKKDIAPVRKQLQDLGIIENYGDKQ